MTEIAAADELRLLIERVERLEEEKKGISDDVRDVYAEAKARGYDPKTMRAVVRLRKMEKNARDEAEALLETYKAALGMADGYEAPRPRVSTMPTPLEEAIETTISVNGGPAVPLATVKQALDRVQGDDETYGAARRLVVNDGKASTSYIQRQLRIGYNLACRLVERMERDGIVSPPDDHGRRAVLMTAAA